MKLVDLVKNYRNSSPLKITIVSPFVSEGFIKTVVEELSPNKMLVVADKRSELEMDKIDKIAKVEVRLAGHSEEDKKKDKLVHAKLFLFDWKNGAKVFVWGSANATQAALGTEPNNAECISLYKIRDSDNEPESAIELYFKQLCQNAPATIEPRDAELGTVKLSLPGFSLIKRQDNFDRWLEEGKLFDPDKYKTILPKSVKTVCLTIPLKKDIKTKNLAKQYDFDCSETKTLSYDKFKDVPDVDLPSIKDYALNTVYGYWIPDQIHTWFKEEPKSEIRKAMEDKIEALIEYIKTNRKELIDIFMEHLDDLVKDQQVQGSLREYFQDDYLLDDNKLKRDSIKNKLSSELDEHIDKCRELRDQSLKVHDLFPIRFSLKQWDKFARSLVESISESRSKKNGLGKIFINRTEGNGKQQSAIPEITIDWEDVQKCIKGEGERDKETCLQETLEELRKGDWGKYKSLIHNSMEQELNKKLRKSGKKDATSDTGQSQVNLI